jgi:hypothetical protein
MRPSKYYSLSRVDVFTCSVPRVNLIHLNFPRKLLHIVQPAELCVFK